MGVILENLTFQYSDSIHPTIENLNLEIKENETIALLGISGSGKSTLLNLISSFQKPNSGSIELLNIDKSEVSYIRQSAMDMLFPWLTVKENIEFALKERNQLDSAAKERLVSLIKILGLTEKVNKKSYPTELSGGEKKRLSFACGLSYSPKLILLDEAFTGIDFSLKWELWSFLRAEIKRTKATVILVTHDFDEAIFLADRIVFFNRKKQIDDKEVKVHKTDSVDIEKSLSKVSFMRTKGETLKIYKEINEAI
jgi:ABC-type nitrate/sulfonate/bicarbonate transport system ATPase subunit